MTRRVMRAPSPKSAGAATLRLGQATGRAARTRRGWSSHRAMMAGPCRTALLPPDDAHRPAVGAGCRRSRSLSRAAPPGFGPTSCRCSPCPCANSRADEPPRSACTTAAPGQANRRALAQVGLRDGRDPALSPLRAAGLSIFPRQPCQHGGTWMHRRPLCIWFRTDCATQQFAAGPGWQGHAGFRAATPGGHAGLPTGRRNPTGPARGSFTDTALRPLPNGGAARRNHLWPNGRAGDRRTCRLTAPCLRRR